MGFFERQEAARRDTRRLVAAFVVAVAFVVVVVDFVVLTFGFGLGPRAIARTFVTAPHFVVGVTLAVLLPMTWASLAKARELQAGGAAALAKQLGAVPVTTGNTADAERRLRNVVDEMSIAAGIPAPRTYVLRGEPGINAFAAGRDRDDAAVIVTEGALAHLNREELQAVVAHEFSHVLNGDMALNLRLAAWLHGLYLISLVARKAMRNRDGKRRFFRVYLLGLALLAVGSAGHVAARVLQAGVSRRREELADASAVQFTRNPLSLKSALEKIARHEAGSAVASPAGASLAHMFFAQSAPVRWQRFMQSLFATHPPIEERIRAVAALAGVPADEGVTGESVRAEGVSTAASAMASSAATSPGMAPSATASTRVASSRTTPSGIAPPSDDGARALRALESAAAAPATAAAVALAVAAAAEPERRRRHLGAIARAFGPSVADSVTQAITRLDAAPARGRFLAVTRSLEPVAALAAPERAKLLRAVRTLVADVPEPTLLQVCFATLLERRGGEARDGAEPVTLKAALPQIAALLVVLATTGHPDPRRQQRAYAAGLAKVAPVGTGPAWAVPADRLAAVRAGFDVLARLHRAARRPVADALGAVALEDARIGTEEGELVRTACLLMGVSPPQFDDASGPDVATLLASAR